MPLRTGLVLLALTGCNEGSPVDTTRDDPTAVVIDQQNVQLLIGNNRQLSAVVRSRDGTQIFGVELDWSSSNPDIVVVDANGIATGVGPGRATVFATAGIGLGTASINVPDAAGNTVGGAGTITSPDGKVRLIVPVGALAEDAEITILPADFDSLPDGSISIGGSEYEFAPAGLQFVIPAALSIRYDPNLTSTSEARRLRLHRLQTGAWAPVAGSTVDTDTMWVSGPISSFSIYGVAPVPNAAPEVAITSPEDGLEIGAGLDIDFEGTGTDLEDGVLAGESMTWSSDVDGDLGTGEAITSSDLSLGEHVVTLTGTDSDGATDSESVAVTVIDGPPIITFITPAGDTVVKVGDEITFSATATDAVEGTIDGATITWTSSIDGALGMGPSVTTSTLSLGEHVITAAASDSGGLEGTASITVTVADNEPPVVTITNPDEGEDVPDRSGVTLRGSAEDAEDGTLTGAALQWSSDVDGDLGSGTRESVTNLTIGEHVITLTATDSDGATGSASVTIDVFEEPPPFPKPTLEYVGEAAGTMTLSVDNSGSYDNELFTLDASYPACAPAPVPSRMAVEIYDQDGTLLDTYCDFDDNSDLNAFTVTPADPPPEIYIELVDREEGRSVRSNSIVPVPTTGTTIAGVVANDRDVDLNTLDPGEALSNVTIRLYVDTSADGVIDPGEPLWDTDKTNSDGSYEFTDLWERNYIVQAVSPSNTTVLRELAADGSALDQTGTLVTAAGAGAGATLNQSGTNQVGNTDPPDQGDELPRWDYAAGTAAADGGAAPGGPGPNSMNGALTIAPTHFVFLYENGSASGTVTDGTNGVSGVRVTITRCRTAPAAPASPAAGACTTKHGAPAFVKNDDTNGSGAYSFSGLLEGVYQIEVTPGTGGYTSVDVPGGAGSYLLVISGSGAHVNIPDFEIS